MGTLQKAIIAGAVLLALHTYRVQATCAVVVGTSDPYGVECGTPFTQVERNTTLHLKKLQTYTKDGCIVGLKTQFGYKAGEAKLLGSSAGAERTLALGDSEYINGVDIGENATCINFLRFTTGKGQNLAVGGGAGALVTKPRTDAYVFGFAGTAGGDCAHGIGQLQFIWAIEDCSRSLLGAQVNPNPTQNPTPNPSAPPEEQPGRPVPVDIPVPNLVPTPTPIPVPVFNVSVPVPVPVPVPTPINVTIPQYELKVINVSVPIPVPVPTPVDVPNPVPVPVPTPINVTIPVPTPVPVPVPTPIPIPTPVPVQTPAPVTNVQVQVPNAPTGTMANVAAICDVNQDLMVFTSSSSLRCVFDYAGAPTGRVVTSGSSRFAQYANVLCFDLGCQQVPVPAPASIMSYGKSGGFEVMTGDTGSYRSYGGSGMWNNYNTYMAHGRRRMLGWNPFARMLEKDEEITIQITKNKPEPPAAPEPKPVYVPVPVPVRVPVQIPAPAPVRNLMVARCSFAICIPRAGQQQLQWQQQQVVQQQAVQQQAQQWQQQQQWGAGASVDSVDDDSDDMQMYANNNNMRTMG